MQFPPGLLRLLCLLVFVSIGIRTSQATEAEQQNLPVDGVNIDEMPVWIDLAALLDSSAMELGGQPMDEAEPAESAESAKSPQPLQPAAPSAPLDPPADPQPVRAGGRRKVWQLLARIGTSVGSRFSGSVRSAPKPPLPKSPTHHAPSPMPSRRNEPPAGQVRLWLTVGSTVPHTLLYRTFQQRLLQVNWRTDAVLPDDWVGLFDMLPADQVG